MLKENTIYCGDNLNILKGFEDNSIDLIYIDPPFNTSKKYEIIWNDGAEIRQYEDRFVKMGESGKYSKDMNTYLEFIEPRLREIYRVLKPIGSFYLHCDYHADSYLRILCDQIFGYNNLQNEIIWDYGGANRTKTNFPKKHDIILFYTKTNKYTFNPQYDSIDKSYTQTRLRTDEDGRQWVDQNLGKLTQETFERMKKENRVFQTKTGNWRRKQYIDEMAGDQLTDVWDIDIINSQSNERLGYPTQKPEALLERIIKASSNENDLVLDSFCGCGTTIAVAKRLKRRFIGIDISPTACRLISKRINYPIANIIGLPLNAEEIESLSGYEFQNSVINLLDPSLNTIKVNNRGADGGIDGSYYDILISVKKYKAGRKDLDEFIASIYRNKKTEGLFIALDFTSDFIKEVARLKREDEIDIYHFTIKQIVNGEHKEIISKENQEHGKLF